VWACRSLEPAHASKEKELRDAQIKGHRRQYYVDTLRKAREATLAEFKKRDDQRFLATLNDPDWGGPAHSYQLWSHSSSRPTRMGALNSSLSRGSVSSSARGPSATMRPPRIRITRSISGNMSAR
jgi:hypothetical protein